MVNKTNNVYNRNPSSVFNTAGGWRLPFSETGVCQPKNIDYTEIVSSDLKENINSNNKKYQIELIQEYFAGTAKSVQINVPGNLLLQVNDINIWNNIKTEEKINILRNSLKLAQQKYSKNNFNVSIGYCYSDLNTAELNKTKWLGYLAQNNNSEEIFLDWEK